MKLSIAVTAMAMFACLSGASVGYAQTGGMFGARNVGGGTIQAGNRNAFGNNSDVGGTAGTRLEQIGNTGQITGSERFIRDNRTADQFVGSDTADSGFVGAATGGTTGAAGIGGIGGMGGAGGFGNFGGAAGARGGAMGNRGNRQGMGTGRAGQNSNRAVAVQTQLSIGFRYNKTATTTVQSRLGERLSRLSSNPGSERLQVAMEGRTVTLRGQVASEADRDLLVQLTRLEPGVETVRDELTISSDMPNLRSPGR